MKNHRLSNVLSLSRTLVVAAVALAALGCAETRSSMKKRIQDLEREVTRVQAEKANLASRYTDLDDKLLVLEKKKDCDSARDPRKGLDVIRLRPDEESLDIRSGEQVVPFVAYDEVKEDPDDKGKRPVLTLAGSPRSSYAPAQRERFDNSVPLTGEGDNLGVVNTSATSSQPTPSGPMDAFHEAYRDYSNKAYARALEGFSKFLADHPDHSYADNAMFWRGECMLAQGQILKAIGEYERLLRRYPRSEKSPSALYRIGFSYDKMNDRAKASEYYFKVVDSHPGTDAARRASRRMAAIREAGNPTAGLVPTSARR